MLSLHWSGEWKFVWGMWVTWPRWPPCPYMVKTLQKSSSAAYQNLFKGWPWVDLDLFYSKVKFGLLCFYMGKTVRTSFNGRNLKQMTRVTWGICLHKNPDPRGLSAPAPGLYTCIKISKHVFKITLKKCFWNLHYTGKVIRPFCWHQNFVPKGLSTPVRGDIHVAKH